ncbi:RGS domain-containing protein [Phycomyces nitens]|nr:RGS domain-containing protein [Phycomyces nitens]
MPDSPVMLPTNTFRQRRRSEDTNSQFNLDSDSDTCPNTERGSMQLPEMLQRQSTDRTIARNIAYYFSEDATRSSTDSTCSNTSNLNNTTSPTNSSTNIKMPQAYRSNQEMTVENIMEDGLKAMLKSKIPLGYYICHLMEEYSCENLFFYLAVEQYEHHQFETKDAQHIAAKRIYSTYISQSSQLEINLESKIHKAVVQALLDSDSLVHVFESAKQHVFELLNLSYHRFISSPLWDTMIEQSPLTPSYDNKSRRLIAQEAAARMHQTLDQLYSPLGSVRSMVLIFCRTFLHCNHELTQTKSDTRRTSRVRSKSVDAKKPRRFDFFTRKPKP